MHALVRPELLWKGFQKMPKTVVPLQCDAGKLDICQCNCLTMCPYKNDSFDNIYLSHDTQIVHRLEVIHFVLSYQ